MPDPAEQKIDRRPIEARSTWWAKSLASSCARAGIKPNQVSLASVTFAVAGGIMFLLAAGASSPVKALLFAGAALGIQLRLLCNLIDGMIAVEGHMQSKLGPVYNELPDRVADTIFLVSAGYASQAGSLGIELGLAAALLAVATAYIRAFGAAQGLPQDFSGPMAKQHRMFVLTVASLAAALEAVFRWTPHAITVGLMLIAFGGLVTCVRRTRRMAKNMESRPE